MVKVCKEINEAKKAIVEDRLNLVITDDILYDVIKVIEDSDLNRELISVRICSGYFSKDKVAMKNDEGWVVLKGETYPYLAEEIVSDMNAITENTEFVSINLEKELSYKLDLHKVEMRNVISGVNNPYWKDESIECIEIKGGVNYVKH